MTQIEIKKYHINNLDFTVRTAGLENSGDLVVLLHGFPESSLMWEPLMKILAEKGYRVIAPNQRGYSSDARPKGFKNYTMKLLASDVVTLAEKVGFKNKFHLVGHDIGAVSWLDYSHFISRVGQLYLFLIGLHISGHLIMILHKKKKALMCIYFNINLSPNLFYALDIIVP
ncbi:MAG: alpha/beta hydrolase [Lactobacillus crispatus]|jgi:pimeloyl-ACP methyl ester carboxylesterase|nr:alpha/beta hydrolase [Lactobacillus crispatus]MCI1364797.1 alpha/beta hydrolase [Lactobacillus crispatus]MCI1524067.1 alpha/beta hydrolase [Lactobacillus crispatus]